MRSRFLALAAVLTSATLVAAQAHATGFTDPTGDFLASFTGAQSGDLDILSGSAVFTSDSLRLSSTMNGAIGPTSGFYIWGVDRGNGSDRLITSGPPAVGTPDMLLDAVVRLQSDGGGLVLAFPVMGPPVTTLLDPSMITISGNTISARIPRNLLPSTGFDFADYTYVHWSRSVIGSQEFIADLAPDTASFTATFVPEPGAWGLLIAGFALTGAALRLRRRTASA